MMNLLMIELNMVEKEGKKEIVFFRKYKSYIIIILRHNIIELIETEKEYVKDLALVVEVKLKNV